MPLSEARVNEIHSRYNQGWYSRVAQDLTKALSESKSRAAWLQNIHRVTLPAMLAAEYNLAANPSMPEAGDRRKSGSERRGPVSLEARKKHGALSDRRKAPSVPLSPQFEVFVKTVQTVMTAKLAEHASSLEGKPIYRPDEAYAPIHEEMRRLLVRAHEMGAEARATQGG